ncbi:MAG: hypothetical protein QOG35_2863 [Solirubrobacteraceae bacterium]|nr:hypothetical protein [Solirubrobacteraceae bacterium]
MRAPAYDAVASGSARRVPTRLVAGHSDRYRPLAAYGGLIAAFNAAVGLGLLAAVRSGRLPARLDARDLVLYGVATAKLSRILTRSRVTSAVRAPFTRFHDDAGGGEVDERARGTGLRRAVGELLVCPHCIAQWVAAALVGAHLASPRVARAVASLFVVFWVAEQANAIERRVAA